MQPYRLIGESVHRYLVGADELLVVPQLLAHEAFELPQKPVPHPPRHLVRVVEQVHHRRRHEVELGQPQTCVQRRHKLPEVSGDAARGRHGLGGAAWKPLRRHGLVVQLPVPPLLEPGQDPGQLLRGYGHVGQVFPTDGAGRGFQGIGQGSSPEVGIRTMGHLPAYRRGRCLLSDGAPRVTCEGTHTIAWASGGVNSAPGTAEPLDRPRATVRRRGRQRLAEGCGRTCWLGPWPTSII